MAGSVNKILNYKACHEHQRRNTNADGREFYGPLSAIHFDNVLSSSPAPCVYPYFNPMHLPLNGADRSAPGLGGPGRPLGRSEAYGNASGIYCERVLGLSRRREIDKTVRSLSRWLPNARRASSGTRRHPHFSSPTMAYSPHSNPRKQSAQISTLDAVSAVLWKSWRRASRCKWAIATADRVAPIPERL